MFPLKLCIQPITHVHAYVYKQGLYIVYPMISSPFLHSLKVEKNISPYDCRSIEAIKDQLTHFYKRW